MKSTLVKAKVSGKPGVVVAVHHLSTGRLSKRVVSSRPAWATY